ncbi:hypothetical protein [Salinarimonas rosea]|uniref:hypothetical protein n=1 Tax=Salinarimonas rosea TaxID=552063 RepID=UPI000490D1BC|nr:hypothetical protein [Salinarimonas rosea]
MITVEIEAETDAQGRVNGLALARQMIARAYGLVAGSAGRDDAKTPKLFNAVLLQALDDVLENVPEPGLPTGAASRAETERLLEVYRSFAETTHAKEPVFEVGAMVNRQLATIERYQETCREARECIETLAIAAGVDGTESMTELFFRIDQAAYEEPVSLLPFPREEDRAAFHKRPSGSA